MFKPEEIIQKVAAKILRQYLRPDWKFTHIPNGAFTHISTAVRLKAMGLESGWPDLFFMAPVGPHCMELKSKKGVLRPDQKVFQSWCVKYGTPYVVARSVSEVLTALYVWDCLTVSRDELVIYE